MITSKLSYKIIALPNGCRNNSRTMTKSSVVMFVKQSARCPIGGRDPTIEMTKNIVLVNPSIIGHQNQSGRNQIPPQETTNLGKEISKRKKAFFRWRSTPAKSIRCFICNKEGHWANAFPQKLRKGRLDAYANLLDN